ncbi:retrovirus-related pol polyprotein from transposon TNT 1-94 [Tanacetum coccineum]
MVKLNAQCSVVLQNKLPPKEKDPGSFIIPCIIGNTTVSNALADLGASISVMPFLMFKRLGLGTPKLYNMVIEIADRSMQSPKGIVENVLVKIDKFIFPVDLVILDIVEVIPEFDDEVGIRLENLEEGIEMFWDAQDPEITREINPQLRPQFLRFGNRIHHQNPLSRACYNKVMSQELVYTGNDFVGMAKNLYVFIGCLTFLIDFIVLEDVSNK